MDSFFGIGISELFFIAIIALIVLGPERLPGAIREVAKWSRTIRNLSSELTSQFGEEMKAFDDLNPNKILRELTEDPAEQAEKAAGAKAAAKPPAKPASAKTTTAKTTPAKTTPAKTTAAKPAASATGTASTTTPKYPTPPMPKKVENPRINSSAAAADTSGSADAAASETDNRILPPAAEGADGVESSPPAAPAASAAGDTAPSASSGEAAKPGGDDARDEKIIVDTPAPHSALTVNGKSGAEGDA